MDNPLIYFEREKSWRCGNSFIPVSAKCYKHPITGKDLGYRVIKNPITGRKKRIRVALDYQEYLKARAKTVKNTQNKLVRRTRLQEQYLADVEQLTAKSKQAFKQKQLTDHPYLKNVVKLEDAIAKQRFETLGVFDQQGKLLTKIRGNVNSVSIPEEQINLLKDSITTHNHPDGLRHPASKLQSRGNSFSNEDVTLAMSGDVKSMRVVSPYYRHILERPAKGWGLMSDAFQFLRDAENETEENFNRLIDRKVRNKGVNHPDVESIIDYANHQHHHFKMKIFAKKIGAVYKRIPLNRIL